MVTLVSEVDLYYEQDAKLKEKSLMTIKGAIKPRKN